MFGASYHARDECQGAGVISDGVEFVTSGQIPVEADVSCNVLSSVDSVRRLALAVDGWLKLMMGEISIYIYIYIYIERERERENVQQEGVLQICCTYQHGLL